MWEVPYVAPVAEANPGSLTGEAGDWGAVFTQAPERTAAKHLRFVGHPL